MLVGVNKKLTIKFLSQKINTFLLKKRMQYFPKGVSR